VLSVQGVRPEEHVPEHKVYGVSQAALAAKVQGEQPFVVHCSDAAAEREKVEKLFIALTEAKKKTGENVSGSLDSFKSFVQKKTEQIRKQHSCQTVEYSVDVAGGKVKLTAKAKA
jgi:hypothetical protein